MRVPLWHRYEARARGKEHATARATRYANVAWHAACMRAAMSTACLGPPGCYRHGARRGLRLCVRGAPWGKGGRVFYVWWRLLLLWVLLQPLRVPGVWAWQIIGAYEIQAQCEIARWDQPYHDWTICARIEE